MSSQNVDKEFANLMKIRQRTLNSIEDMNNHIAVEPDDEILKNLVVVRDKMDARVLDINERIAALIELGNPANTTRRIKTLGVGVK